jgi:hypothetical protein
MNKIVMLDIRFEHGDETKTMHLPKYRSISMYFLMRYSIYLEI